MAANRHHGYVRAFILAAALAALATPAAAEPPATIVGNAVALDGDTLLVGVTRVRVRLFGIDAPEMTEPDGWFARATLDDLLAEHGPAVDCDVLDVDRYGRPVARCVAGVSDLGGAMIWAGGAVPWRTDSHGYDAPSGLAGSYDAAEFTARRERRGRWADMPEPLPTRHPPLR